MMNFDRKTRIMEQTIDRVAMATAATAKGISAFSAIDQFLDMAFQIYISGDAGMQKEKSFAYLQPRLGPILL